jgi:hypothetical protein
MCSAMSAGKSAAVGLDTTGAETSLVAAVQNHASPSSTAHSGPPKPRRMIMIHGRMATGSVINLREALFPEFFSCSERSRRTQGNSIHITGPRTTRTACAVATEKVRQRETGDTRWCHEPRFVQRALQILQCYRQHVSAIWQRAALVMRCTGFHDQGRCSASFSYGCDR